MDNTTRVRSRIPDFATLEDAAQFWDAHDTTEFEDEWEPVELDVARPLMHQLSVRLEGPVFHRLVAIAKRSGVPVSAQAAEMIREAIERAGDADVDGAPGSEPPE